MGLIDIDAFLKDLEYEGADVCEVYDGGYCAIHGYSFDLIKEIISKQSIIEAEPVRHGCPYCCDTGEGGHGRLKYSYDDHDGMTMSIHPSEKRKDGTCSLAWWATVHFRGECRDFYIEVCPFCGRRLVPLKEEHDCTSPNYSAKMDGNQ